MVSCHIQFPEIDVCVYAVIVHGTCCLLGSLPIALFLWFVKDHSYRAPISVTTGVMAASSVVAYLWVFWLPFLVQDGESTARLSWLGPFLASTFGFSTFFKCINVAFLQFPQGANSSLEMWIYWFVFLPEPHFSKGKTRRAAKSEIMTRLKCFGYKVVVLGLVISILLARTADDDNRLDIFALSSSSSFFINTAMTGYLHIWFIYLWASFCLDLSSLFIYGTTRGTIALECGFDNPLLASRSLKEAWGVRWNVPVQALLQRTSYVPMRKRGHSRFVAALATFFVSGLLHEYNFFVHNYVAYEPGKATVFFVVMGMIMLAESWVWGQFEHKFPSFVHDTVDRLPSCVVAVFLTMTASIPFELYFIRSWLDAGVVEGASKMVPHVSCTGV